MQVNAAMLSTRIDRLLVLRTSSTTGRPFDCGCAMTISLAFYHAKQGYLIFAAAQKSRFSLEVLSLGGHSAQPFLVRP